MRHSVVRSQAATHLVSNFKLQFFRHLWNIFLCFGTPCSKVGTITQVWERNRPDEFLQFCITFVEMHLVSSSHYLCSVLSIYVCLSAILLPHLNADCLSSCDGTAVLQLRKLPPDPPHCQATGKNGKNGYYMPNAKAVTLFVRRS